MKTCNTCHVEQPSKAFYKNIGKIDRGLLCKSCVVAKRTARIKENAAREEAWRASEAARLRAYRARLKEEKTTNQPANT